MLIYTNFYLDYSQVGYMQTHYYNPPSYFSQASEEKKYNIADISEEAEMGSHCSCNNNGKQTQWNSFTRAGFDLIKEISIQLHDNLFQNNVSGR